MRRMLVNAAAFAFYGYYTSSIGFSVHEPLFWIGMLCLGVVQINNSIE